MELFSNPVKETKPFTFLSQLAAVILIIKNREICQKNIL